MNIQSKPPSQFAPANADPIKLANVTVRAVDQIGSTAAEEIDETAKQLVQGAAEVAQKLQELAAAVREHSKIASEHVNNFCAKATTVIEGVRGLQDKLIETGKDASAEPSDVYEDKLPLPWPLRNGPGVQPES